MSPDRQQAAPAAAESGDGSGAEPPSPDGIADAALDGIAVDVVVEEEGWRALLPDAETALLPFARAALAAGLDAPMPAAGAELCIVLTDDATVRDLNREYRGKDAPTNVLSFALTDGEDEDDDDAAPAGIDLPLMLGDIFLALETVRREAADQGKPARDHALHLVVHGVLHLLGHDHLTETDATAMERLETGILAALGIADPYADPSAPDGPAGAVPSHGRR